MPYLADSAYKLPSTIFRQGHWSTIYSGAVKRTQIPNYSRYRLILDDGDFLLVDEAVVNTKQAVILCHGLEGNSQSRYNNTCANYFLENDFSVFAWNNRSCGGEMNELPQLYHHGSVEDLEAVINYVLSRGFAEIYLMGFSLGGAQILNYLGQKPVHHNIIAAVSISTPIDLKCSADKLEKGFSRVYLNRFMKRIKAKVTSKAHVFPELINLQEIEGIYNFDDLAKHFLVPVHGFESPEDFYTQASPITHFPYIRTPVLILNAMDDPIIGELGFPVEFAETSEYLYLETPKYGGHCGFLLAQTNYTFSEVRALEFFKEIRNL